MKVHFADAGCFKNANAFLDVGIKYTLQTYHQIAANNDKLAFDYDTLNKFSHIIIDSGLFSIMFGCDKEKIFNEQVAISWMDRYINFINKSQFKNASFVECDVQKKLGANLAWDFRKEMKAKVDQSRGDIIHVYHLEDENPDRLIDYADYIAISIPELRFNVTRKELLHLTSYITNKAVSRGKKVHLLGCTELKLMKTFNFCYSCDSTSWSAPARFGWLNTKMFGKMQTEKAYSQFGKKGINRFNKCAYVARLIHEEYKLYAGDQS